MIQNKEELIGTDWECPCCKKKVTITKDGIEHMDCTARSWWYRSNLEELFQHQKFNEESWNKILFGDKNGPPKEVDMNPTTL